MELPLALVERAVKAALPDDARAPKPALYLLNVALSEFIRTIALRSNRFCVSEKKKYVTDQHVEQALEEVFPLDEDRGAGQSKPARKQEASAKGRQGRKGKVWRGRALETSRVGRQRSYVCRGD